MTIRLGTRRSALATAQATWVADRLRQLGHDVELTPITTFGDTSSRPLSEIGGTGVFATGIRLALHRGEIDVAVHSLKDLPVIPEPGLHIAAIPVREDPRDALVARDGLTLGELPSGSVVGTGSPRRAAQLAALGLGLQVRSIRGNVGTRLGLVEDGTCDAIVLARAGLARLGQLDVVTEVLDPLQMLSAPGQGALAVEVRADDQAMVSAVAVLDDDDTRASVNAERAVLAALEAGCTAPIGVLAEVSEGDAGQTELWIRAFVGAEDGSASLRRSTSGPTSRAHALGEQLAAQLLEDGADQITALHDGPRPGDPPTEPPGAGARNRPPAASTPASPATPTRPDQPAPERAQ
jgi:hydroxymethylbilane synthase